MGRKVWLFSIVVAVVTFAVFSPTLYNDFVNWDDAAYIYKNRMIRSIDGQFIKWAFTSIVSGNWHPITMISHAVDYKLFGVNPAGHHLTSILIHSINSSLVFILSWKLMTLSLLRVEGSEKPWCENGQKSSIIVAALTTGLLFGIHPLHVESVAWAAERKDLLCALFFLLSLLSYLRYTRGGRGWLFYALSLLAFIAALLSKPMAVTLPVLLIIADIYPLRRWQGIRSVVLVEKLPFVLLSALSSIIAISTQSAGGAIGSLENYSILTRILIAARAYIFYLVKMVLPTGLAPYYPHQATVSLAGAPFLASLTLCIVITVLSFLLYKKYRMVAAAWAAYFIMLFPVSGIVQIGAQSAADRYTYLPSIAPFLLVGIVAGIVLKRLFKGRVLPAGITALVVISVIFAPLTIKQISVWQNSITLWSHEIALYPDNVPIAYTNRGIALGGLGKIDDATADFSRAIEIMPNHVLAYYNRAKAYSMQRRYNDAVTDLTIAIRLNSSYAGAYFNRGAAYANLGKYPEAITDFKRVISLEPNATEAYQNISKAYALMGDSKRAAEYSERARGR